jgi:hypothetical protein
MYALVLYWYGTINNSQEVQQISSHNVLLYKAGTSPTAGAVTILYFSFIYIMQKATVTYYLRCTMGISPIPANNVQVPASAIEIRLRCHNYSSNNHGYAQYDPSKNILCSVYMFHICLTKCRFSVDEVIAEVWFFFKRHKVLLLQLKDIIFVLLMSTNANQDDFNSISNAFAYINKVKVRNFNILKCNGFCACELTNLLS